MPETDTSQHVTIRVCVDCYFAYHEGDYRPERWPDADRQVWGLFDLSDGAETICSQVTSGIFSDEHAPDCDARNGEDCTWGGECEQEDFSWSACDACGSTLGGSRHLMTLWTKP